MRDYVAQAGNVDVPRVAGGHRDPERVRALLTALARNVATEVSISVLARDAGGADESMGRDTVRDYLDALERLMVLEPVPAWSTHLRSKATLRGAPKRHFVDPSLAVAALESGPVALAVDTSRIGEPQMLGVITSTGYGYRRPDGVAVVPIGALGP